MDVQVDPKRTKGKEKQLRTGASAEARDRGDRAESSVTATPLPLLHPDLLFFFELPYIMYIYYFCIMSVSSRRGGGLTASICRQWNDNSTPYQR
ncbi:hypothetical protein EW639_00705 [Porphyromonas gingivalis]|nr:hypothetical protein EW639_00705 [Porphyromonas gingivalis]